MYYHHSYLLAAEWNLKKKKKKRRERRERVKISGCHPVTTLIKLHYKDTINEIFIHNNNSLKLDTRIEYDRDLWKLILIN